MAKNVLFSRKREKTFFMKTRLLFDIHKRDGDALYSERRYRKAVECYDAALSLDRTNKTAFVARSRCKLNMGCIKQALADVEAALTVDGDYPEGLYQKAEIFFRLHNYEMALLFYRRGHQQNPEIKAFEEGIRRCQKAINEFIKGSQMKMTPAGDLSLYVHKKMRGRRPKEQSPIANSRETGIPQSADFRKKKALNPLVRLERKRPLRLNNQNRSKRRGPFNPTNENDEETPRDSTLSEPDEKTMKEILGKLYGDKEYLKNIIYSTEGTKGLEADVTSYAEEGLNFLHDRITYWSQSRLPPPPPPSPPLSRKHTRQGGGENRELTESPLPRQKSVIWQREVSDLIRLLRSRNVEPEDEIAEENKSVKKHHKGKTKKKELQFSFRTYRPETVDKKEETVVVRDQKEVCSEGNIAEDGQLEVEVQDPINLYLTKEIELLEEAFSSDLYEDCRRRAVLCLQAVYNYTDEEIADKRDLVAKVHSFLGNALLELREYDEATVHHEKDLDIGEQCDIAEPVSRALGNLGRAFTLQKHYHKALGAFARKAKLVQTPVEVAWLFHEIGNIFLSLNQYEYARDSGKKSLESGEEAGHRMYELQACVLVAVSQVKLKRYEDAYTYFERALDLAKLEDDTKSEEMIQRALIEVNQRIFKKLKDSQSSEQNDQTSSKNCGDVPTEETGSEEPVSGKIGDNVEDIATDQERMSPGENKHGD